MSFRSKGTWLKEERAEDVLIKIIVATAFGTGTAGLIWIGIVICGLAASVWP